MRGSIPRSLVFEERSRDLACREFGREIADRVLNQEAILLHSLVGPLALESMVTIYLSRSCPIRRQSPHDRSD
jgi:hypothetical protein